MCVSVVFFSCCFFFFSFYLLISTDAVAAAATTTAASLIATLLEVLFVYLFGNPSNGFVAATFPCVRCEHA